MGRVKHERFEVLDLCRGISALIVVGIHTSASMRFFWPVVDFFFVLSGFVIAPMYLGEVSARNIIRIRLQRLWPTIIFAVSFGLILQLFEAAKDKYMSSGNEVTHFPTLIQIFSGIFFLQVIFPSLSYFNIPLWSTSVELIVNFALIPFMLKYKKRSLFFIILAAEILYYFGLKYDFNNVNSHGPIYNFSGLARGFMGISLGILLRSIFPSVNFLKNTYFRTLLLLISFYTLFELNKNGNYQSGFFNFMLCGYIVFYFALSDNPKNRIICELCRLSRRYSFGIFAIHAPLVPVTGLLHKISFFSNIDIWKQNYILIVSTVFIAIIILQIYFKYISTFLETNVKKLIFKIF
jgi:peptidoglycan/LPS O-acetylase OafA/YrhL